MLKTIISDQYIAIVRIAEILLILLIIPLFYNFVSIDKEASETLYIDATNIDSVVTSLEHNGYTVTIVDKMMMQVDQVPATGWFTLDKKSAGRFSFFKNIYKDKAETMGIVIYAGETHNELIARLANDMHLDKKKLYEQYKALSRFKEAEIFSGPYRVARNVEEAGLMSYLFDQSNKILDFFIENTFANRPDHFQLKVLLTMASIIQKESNAVEEMPLISSVIYNRLDKNMKLQMDSTLNYGEFSHTIVTPERIKTDTSYYNTYKHKGLPPFPLATISVAALRAAMFPEKSKHIFFMLQPGGKHKFAETYEEHLDNIRVFRAYQLQRKEEKKKQQEEEAKKMLEAEKALAKKEKEKNESNQSKSVSENNAS
jgi:UPF0755 protein